MILGESAKNPVRFLPPRERQAKRPVLFHLTDVKFEVDRGMGNMTLYARYWAGFIAGWLPLLRILQAVGAGERERKGSTKIFWNSY